MKKFWPVIPVVLGILLVFGGFAYDVMFAGIPYQDPTPEMSARYSRDAQIASTIMVSGFAAFFFGLVSAIVNIVIWRSNRPGRRKEH